MQGEPARGIAFCLVFYIADDRMAGIRKMDPNLVAAAGFFFALGFVLYLHLPLVKECQKEYQRRRGIRRAYKKG